MRRTLILLAALFLCLPALRAGVNGVTATPLPIPSTLHPALLARGADGTIWYGDRLSGSVGIVTTDGVTTNFPLADPGGAVDPSSLAVDREGNAWFVYSVRAPRKGIRGAVGKMTKQGVFSSWTVADRGICDTHDSIDAGCGIAIAPTGEVWFALSDLASFGRLDGAGNVTTYPMLENDLPFGLAFGADGDLYIGTPKTMVRFLLATHAFETVPLQSAGTATVSGETLGPDGSIWFSEWQPDEVSAVTAGGSVTTVELPVGVHPWGMAPTPDGTVVVAERDGRHIVELDPRRAIAGTSAQIGEFSSLLNTVVAPRPGGGYSVLVTGSELSKTNIWKLDVAAAGAPEVDLRPELSAATSGELSLTVRVRNEGRVASDGTWSVSCVLPAPFAGSSGNPVRLLTPADFSGTAEIEPGGERTATLLLGHVSGSGEVRAQVFGGGDGNTLNDETSVEVTVAGTPAPGRHRAIRR